MLRHQGVTYSVHVVITRPVVAEHAGVRLFRSRESWTEAELAERGLPLYWSREWLLEQLTRRTSWAALTQLTTYSEPTLRRWKEVHGIAGDPRSDAIRAEWRSGKYPSVAALAAAWGLSTYVVRGILKDPPSEAQ